MSESRLPVTVLSGFLRAGKITLLHRVLSKCERRRVAIIVNDMSEMKIGAPLVQSVLTAGPVSLPLDMADPLPAWRRAEVAV